MLKTKGKYVCIKVDGKQITEHRYVMQQSLGRELGNEEVVHHINGDKGDNRLENLELMTRETHTRLHSTGYKPSNILVEAFRKRWLGNTNWLGRQHKEESKKQIAESLKLDWALNPRTVSEEVRTKISEGMKGITRSEETRKLQGLAKKGIPKSEEHRRKISETLKRRNLIAKCEKVGCGGSANLSST